MPDDSTPHGNLHLSASDADRLGLNPDELNEEEALEGNASSVDIGKRVFDWRTLASFAVALTILTLAIWKSGINWGQTAKTLKSVNLPIYALAFVVYYSSFPLRTFRWRRLMANANHEPLKSKVQHYPLRSLTEILYLSWFANVIIPAKLGDVYRAFLARRWVGVSMSRTVGTILAERILDLLVLSPLLLMAAILTFHDKLLSSGDVVIRNALIVAVVLAIVAAGVLLIIWRAGDQALRVVPARFHDAYRHLRHGALTSFGRDIPLFVGQTTLVWLLEGGRLACVLWALGLLGSGGVGPSTAIFLALGSSVLTTLPLTPGGLGVVEPFILAVLVLLHVHGVSGPVHGTAAVSSLDASKSIAGAVVVLDRLISYLSIAVIGFFVYAFGSKARGATGSLPQTPAVAL